MRSYNKKQIFLLPFAGGNVYSFNFLKEYITSQIEFVPLELPGRGKRQSEKLLKNKPEAIADYIDQISQLRNGNPYTIYGHSMGAILALPVVAGMEAKADAPELLIVSGSAGLPSFRIENKRYVLEDAAFKKVLRNLGGTSEEVLENEELFNFFSPIMRADFQILEEDGFTEEDVRINTPIYAIMGSEEESNSNITTWKKFSTAEFLYKILPGDHFFIHRHPVMLASIIIGKQH